MDMGDIIRLVFLALIFLSFFGGLFGRNREGEEQQARGAPRPTDVFESGGQDRPRPQRQPQPQPQSQPQRPPQERQMPTTATQWWEELTGNRTQPEPRSQPQPRELERQVANRGDSISRGEAQRAEHQRQRRERVTTTAAGQQSIREGERQMLEQDITDMPEPMELHPRRRRDREIGATAQARRRRTGGDVLRRSMRKPDTLERAFILKEVLDEPLALRERRQATYG
jgi:hypothetical protein